MFNNCEYVQSECEGSIDFAKQIYNIDTSYTIIYEPVTEAVFER